MAHHFVDGISSSDIPHECTSLSGGDIWAKSIGTNTMNWYIHDSIRCLIIFIVKLLTCCLVFFPAK